jgi:hypothetical protein
MNWIGYYIDQSVNVEEKFVQFSIFFAFLPVLLSQQIEEEKKQKIYYNLTHILHTFPRRHLLSTSP